MQGSAADRQAIDALEVHKPALDDPQMAAMLAACAVAAACLHMSAGDGPEPH